MIYEMPTISLCANSSSVFKSFVVPVLCCWAAGIWTTAVIAESPQPTPSAEDPIFQRGRQLYLQHCASCHGPEGKGVPNKYDDALYGEKPLHEVVKIIDETMPAEEPELVVGDDAKAIGQYIYDSFYTAAARAQHKPPRVELLRLSNTQFEQVTADLLATFLGSPSYGNERGLEADYFNSRSFRGNELKIERIDPQVSFAFAEGSPGEGIQPEEFSIRWNGSVIAPETGMYEFCVKTENGFRLWVNDQESALIDGWVASGGEVLEHREKVKLLGGRAYPLRLEFFKFKDKTASIELRWTPPGGVDEPIPQRHLYPKRVPESFVVTVPFPPDDASLGYERGSSVSPAWNDAVTQAAVETANYVVRRIDRLAGTKSEDEKRREKIVNFARRFVETAFRRPLTEEQQELYLDRQFEHTDDLEEALKRVLILALHSPNFLYVELLDGELDSYDVASRLSFGMWDSLPDSQLLQAAAKGDLLKPEVVRRQAERMLRDRRTHYKVRMFFHELLPLDEATQLTKDAELFPMFNDRFVADLKTSLELFIDDVVWSDSSDYRELMLSNDLFLNSQLAQFYDASVDPDAGFQRVSFDENQRAGVVTHPLLLSTLAYHQASSPIHRGVFITRKILSRSLKPPPAAIEFEDSRFDPTLTMREKVTELTKAKACMTCHSVINPLGFSLESYDAIGRFRTMEKEKPIDTTGELETTEGEIVEFRGARDVAEYAARNPTSQRGFIEHLFHHIVKQPARAYGENTLDELRNKFEASGFHIQKLIVEINTLTATAQPSSPPSP